MALTQNLHGVGYVHPMRVVSGPPRTVTQPKTPLDAHVRTGNSVLTYILGNGARRRNRPVEAVRAAIRQERREERATVALLASLVPAHDKHGNVIRGAWWRREIEA